MMKELAQEWWLQVIKNKPKKESGCEISASHYNNMLIKDKKKTLFN